MPVFANYLTTGLVAKFPTLFVCCFVMLAAVMSFFTGLILSNMERNNRRQFEVQRNVLNREYRKEQKRDEEHA